MKKLTFLILILSLVGCSSFEGEANFSADIVESDKCLGDLFPFDPVFVAARDRGGASGLFFQKKGGNIQDVDLLFFEIFYRGQLESLKLEKIGGDDIAAIGQIELGGKCREQTFGYYLEGELQFDELDTKHNGRVSGSLSNGLIKNSKTDEVVGTNLEGSFDFPVFAGQPYEEFTTN